MSNKPWDGDFEPFRIFGNLYFVGTPPASVHLIDTGEGLILLDTGYLESMPTVTDHIRQLGFSPRHIRYILLTHGHIDHMGAAKAFRALSGAKIALGKEDRTAANGTRDLSYAAELGMEFSEPFEPDILLSDGDGIALGNTRVRAIATPGHTSGTVSYRFDVTDGTSTYAAALHGGMGLNTLRKEYLDRYNLPYTLREDFVRSMHRLNQEAVDIYLGNHMQQNNTEGKAARIKAGDPLAFVNPTEWKESNARCIQKIRAMMEKENKQSPDPTTRNSAKKGDLV